MRRSAEGKKAGTWRVRIREAAQSGLSVRQFCRRWNLRECQFYWRQRKLKASRPAPAVEARASFALVPTLTRGIPSVSVNVPSAVLVGRFSMITEGKGKG